MPEIINTNWLEEVSSKIDHFFNIIDTLLGSNQYTPTDPYNENNTTVFPDPDIDLNQNEYTPQEGYSSNIITGHLNRIEKIGKYLLTSDGIVFMVTQAILHAANYRTSKWVDPLIYAIGGFGILPDTFDALFIHYEDTVAKEKGQGLPGVGIFPGKYGAVEQTEGPFGFVTPNTGLQNIVALVGKVLGLIGGTSLTGIHLDKTGAIDYSKTPLISALQNVNAWSPGPGINVISYGQSGEIVPGMSLQQISNIDDYSGLVIAVEDSGTGRITLLKSTTTDSIKDKDSRHKHIIVETQKSAFDSNNLLIPKEEPLSPQQYNVHNFSTPYGENLYRPLKLLSDIGFGKAAGNINYRLTSDHMYSEQDKSKNAKFANTRKVKIVNKLHFPDPMIAQLNSDKRQLYTIVDGRLTLQEIKVDDIAASYPTDDLSLLKDKLYVPLFFQGLTIGNRYCVFRAHVNSIAETYSPSWTEENSYGRSQENVIYNSTGRSLELGFIVYAGHPQELVPMYSKINWLVRQTYPSYSEEGYIDAPPIIRFTLGDMYAGLPVYITNLSLAIPDNITWEVEPGAQVPIALEVTLSLGVLHEKMPSAGGYFYKLASEGIGTSTGDPVGTNILYNTDGLSKIRA